MANLKTYKSSFQRVVALLNIYKREISHLYGLAAFNGLLDLSLPLGIQAILNFIINGQISSSWVLLVVLVTLGTIFSGVIQIMQMSISEKMQQDIFVRAAFDFAYRIPRIKYQISQNYHMQELVNRFFDAVTVQKSVSKLLFDFTRSSLQIIFGLILLSFYHPFFIWFGLLILLLLIVLFYLSAPFGLKTSFEESKYKYKVVHWLEEISQSMVTFKLKGETNLPLVKTDDLTIKYLKARQNHFKVLKFQYGSMVSFKAVITCLLLIIGSILFMEQQINLGQFVAAEIIILLILSAVEKLILTIEVGYDLLTSVEKLSVISDLELDKSNASLLNEEDENIFEKGFKITLKDINFYHDDPTKNLFQNLSLDIQSNQKVCISGLNNAGRSSLLRLMAGLYDHYEGSILYNGIPIQNINLEKTRQYISSSLAQDNIFSGSIKDNITLGVANIKTDSLIKAVELAGLTNYIAALKHGFDTELLPNGKQLSKSIIRRILIARIIVSNPKLILIEHLLDGCNADEEKEFKHIFSEYFKNSTVVIITNDTEIASFCDRIIILEDGKIIADESYQSLIQNPIFSNIFTTHQ